jgi:hypothetical protein
MKPQQWVNAGPDDGAPAALLDRVAAAVAPATIDEIWLFPPRRVADGESVVFVLGAFEPQPDRRRVLTFRFTITRNRRGLARVTEQAGEHGSAPADALPRVIEGVLRRLGDDAEVPPQGEAIRGDVARWAALLADVARAAADG